MGKRDQELTLHLALAYDKQGERDAAAKVLQDGLPETPSAVALSDALVTVLVHENHFEEATRLAEKTYQSHPGDLEAQRTFLRILVRNGDTTTAPALGKKLLVKEPQDAEVLYLNWIIERKAGEYESARAHLAESIARAPAIAPTRAALGSVLVKLHDWTAAREQLQKAIQLGVQERLAVVGRERAGAGADAVVPARITGSG